MTGHSMAKAVAAAALAWLLASCSAPTPPEVLPAPIHTYQLQQEPRGAGQTFSVCTDCTRPTLKSIARLNRTTSRQQAPLPLQQVAPAVRDPLGTAGLTRTARTTLYFGTGDSLLTPQASTRLTALAPLLRQAIRLDVTAYTDNQGRPGPNEQLASARAAAVLLMLRAIVGTNAVAPALSANGQPLCCYVTDNLRESSRAPNRRAELSIELPATAEVARLVGALGNHLSPMPGTASLSPTETERTASAVPTGSDKP
jgi:outer membrane protein OmpA-like peptidoglycan-associated protein